MIALDLHAVAASGLNAAVEGIGVAVLAWALLRATGRQSSGTRFAVWFFALLAIAVLPLVGGGVRGAPGHAPVILSTSWAVYLLMAWAAISAFCFLRLGIGLWQILCLRRSCEDVELASLPPELHGMLAEFASVRQVKLCVSGSVNAPAAVGFFRPAIVVPAWALTELSIDELRVTLLHEMAHLRRFDDWTNLIQKAVKAMFFFHPAVWWIEGRLALEREMACDDLVLEQTANPRAYAASLISFAEKIHRGRELALVHAVVGRVKQISQRVTRILDVKRAGATRVWKPVMGLVAVLSGVALVAAPYTPQVVTFQDSSSGPVLASFHPPAAPPVLKQVAGKQAAVAAPAKMKLRSVPQPRVVMARQEIPAPDMTMMMRSVGFDEQGAQIMTLCIWRVTNGKVETMFFVTRI
ncbi:MAG TPA: M56 family metallopeptidase [Terriglobales bacterium]|nr:M56 family metallopeptidase [Terriglobales bacterium]